MRLPLTRAYVPSKGRSAFTLAEVVTALAIVAMVFGSIILAYTQAARRAQWSGYSLAAQALAIQQIEQARSARWDQAIPTNEIPTINLLSVSFSNGGNDFTGYSWTNLDLPTSGTNFVRATNYVTGKKFIPSDFSAGGAQVFLYMLRVDTVWPFIWGNNNKLYTNTVMTFMAPDNRDPNTLF